ncbi:dsDNA nuclease domain-containing protein [Paenibacillus polymyxa]|uniref:dsDNA nuclease domain-containing protein n=1 Tax=Paenibacillus polymyxa TaxID=1406 RepID=UPI00202416B3|nr:dsDNA nuclease domain-containing protein [Paenibacillus polymyxa]MDU8672521.1 dsDNA nuclease domain-containing protein [Paenibacillus polymyxa]MDU8697428.1 dsDNA nuclease domain-containing protein [Paenibacillus polymyxa]URJ56591.3 dsDNA nuclease domain-containing protein [Paenibacillus polymyxa]URJ64021.3 dsDNA nuclease domain-containing protein [Paenibacillus polymyxa]URJ71101.1 dsDNA nuclease domain-containing protein [Paenibacillus polymyxa]
MSQELIIFKKDTDAVGTNRGFVYQYLKTLIQWLKSHQNKNDVVIYCEVEDDIKQVNVEKGSIEWTQVKCYSSVFNLESNDITKTLYNFFVLYASYESFDGKFRFETNSRLSSRDQLFSDWVEKQSLLENEVELLTKLVIHIQKSLGEMLTEKSDSLKKDIASKIMKLESTKSSATKKKNKPLIENLKIELLNLGNNIKLMKQKIEESETLSDFIKRIEWSFDKVESEHAIQQLRDEAHILLEQIIPKQGSIILYFNRLLSEIFFKSTEAKMDERCIDRELLQEILNETESEIKEFTDQNLIQQLEGLEIKVIGKIDGLDSKLDTIDQKLNNVIADRVSSYPDVMLIDLPTAEIKEIEAILAEESDNQSKLEVKIRKINIKDPEQEGNIIKLATELRCRYLIYLQKLKLKGLHKEYEALKSLETKVQVHCTNTVIVNDETLALENSEFKIERFNPAAFWLNFQNDLKKILKEQKLRSKIDIEDTVIFAQMYQMAAECYLRWHKEGEN